MLKAPLNFRQLPWEKILLYSLLALLAAFTFSTALIEIATVAALLVTVLLLVLEKRNPFTGLDRPALAALAVYTGIVLLSYTWSEFPKQSFRGIFKVLQQVALFILVARIPRDLKSWTLTEKVLLCSYGLVVADGLFQYVTGWDFVRHFRAVDASTGLRITSSFKSYGLLAAFLVLTVPVVLALAFNAVKKSRYQILLFILAFEGLFCLYLTRSRGAWLGLLGGSFLTLLLYRKWKIALALVLAAGIGCLMLPKNVLIHLDINRKEQSIVERFDLWQRAVNVIQAKPLTGTGINTYTKAHEKYDRQKSWRVKEYYAHNGYLQMGAEIGIPGLVSFLAFLVFLITGAFKKSRDLSTPDRNLAAGLIASLLSFLVFAASDTLLHNPQSVLHFWFFAGLLAAAVQRSSSQNPA